MWSDKGGLLKIFGKERCGNYFRMISVFERMTQEGGRKK